MINKTRKMAPDDLKQALEPFFCFPAGGKNQYHSQQFSLEKIKSCEVKKGVMEQKIHPLDEEVVIKDAIKEYLIDCNIRNLHPW